jgi:hypothetical protein
MKLNIVANYSNKYIFLHYKALQLVLNNSLKNQDLLILVKDLLDIN